MAGVNVATLTARLEAQTRDFDARITASERKLGSLGQTSTGVSSQIKDMGVAYKAAMGGMLVVGAKALLDLGIKTQAWGRRYETVFQGVTGTMDKWVKDQGTSFGVAEEHLKGMAAAVGDLLVPMGFSRDAAGGMTREILTLSNALSEWTGGTMKAEEAQNAITRAMLGEREALIPLGVKISELDIQQRLAAKGQEDLTGTALQQAKTLATLELITERSADALTAYAAGGDDAQGAMKDLEATIESLKIQMGNALAEAAPLLGVLADIIALGGSVVEIVIDFIPGGGSGLSALLLGGGIAKAGSMLGIGHIIGGPEAAAAALLWMSTQNVRQSEIIMRKVRENTKEAMKVRSMKLPSFDSELRGERGRAVSGLAQPGPAYSPDMGWADKYAQAVKKVRDALTPLAKAPYEVAGAFATLPEAVDLSLKELSEVFSNNLAAQTAWQSNIDTLIALGLDSVAAEFEAAGIQFAPLLQEALSDPLLVELTRMEAEADAFAARGKLAEALGVWFDQAGIDYAAFADLRSELGITAEAWLAYWSAAQGVGGTNPGVFGPGGIQVNHSGGIVQGPSGATVPIMAMAGERVVPAGISSGGGGQSVVVHVAGSVVSDRDLVDAIRAALRSDRMRGGSLEL